MKLPTPIRRLVTYYGRHGCRATISRAGVAATRALFANRQVVFSCELREPILASPGMPSALNVERLRDHGEVSPREFCQIVSFWNPSLAHRNIRERFKQGASLWVIKREGQLAGFGWTIQGRTLEPHYFRLGPGDVHLFDFLVFPQYRGQGVNPLLVNSILHRLALECQGRAFIEAAEWNRAQLSSLARTPFRRLGSARKITIFGHTLVCWNDRLKTEQERKDESGNPSVDTTAGA